ncbi:hypothetical protein Pmani_028081 [Petrolisthes manimaculis]|uniref:Uncharacterized protein n=1 Tax=Petrolisthes manimaculis TaxID=1843537 RepID=A0AAE1TYC5_9EUCA|nr:hypothetical protein Pmani_028081 [Petrolisthes manimaculis]
MCILVDVLDRLFEDKRKEVERKTVCEGLRVIKLPCHYGEEGRTNEGREARKDERGKEGLEARKKSVGGERREG